MAAFTYSVVASPLHDAAAVARITAPVRSELGALDGLHVRDPAHDAALPHLVVVATGGTERAVLDVVRRRASVAAWEPVVLVAHPLHNSLPASLEALARIRADGRRGRVVQVPSDGGLDEAIVDLTSLHELRTARLGLVGRPSDWLVASVPDGERLRARWGIELVDVDIADTIERHRGLEPAAAEPVAVAFRQRGMPDTDTLTAAALHPALCATIDRAGVDAVAVRCFDFITELSTSGCVALAQLNDAGLVAGCEGDVASTVVMMVARSVLGQPGWIANPASIDVADDTVVLAHCTVAPSMVDEVELHTHFESGLGVGIRGTFGRGPVTLLRLGGDALEQHWFANGELIDTGDDPDLCRTQATVRIEPGRSSSLLDCPLGNHLVMVQGHHRARLERWWHLAFGCC